MEIDKNYYQKVSSEKKSPDKITETRKQINLNFYARYYSNLDIS